MSIKLNQEAMENAANLAFDLFDQQGWPLGEMSAEQITKEIIQRYLEMDVAFKAEENDPA